MMKIDEIRSLLSCELSAEPNHDETKLASVLVIIYGSEPKVLMTKKSVSDAIELGFEGILIVKGDNNPKNPEDSKLIPSQVVKHLKKLGMDNKIELFLSLPTNPNFNKIQNKIDSKPTGFITQVVESVDQVSKLVNGLKPHNFKLIPIILFPSDKNLKSAEFLNLDWSNYKENVLDFIKNIHNLTGDILITSPNDFNGVQRTLTKLVI